MYMYVYQYEGDIIQKMHVTMNYVNLYRNF